MKRSRELEIVCRELDRHGYLVTDGLRQAIAEGQKLVRKELLSERQIRKAERKGMAGK